MEMDGHEVDRASDGVFGLAVLQHKCHGAALRNVGRDGRGIINSCQTASILVWRYD